MPLRRLAAPAVLAAALSGCATAPTPPTPAAADAPLIEVSGGGSQIERATERRRAAALTFEQAQDLAQAAIQWQIVLLLAPQDRQAAGRLAAVRASIAGIVNEGLSAGRDALRRGATDQAQQAFLRVLALDAHNEHAMTALREIDRQRAMRRGAERAARARTEEAMNATRSRTVRRPLSEAGEFDLEQSLELLQAGDSVVALAELRRYVARNPRDRAVRERIAKAVHSQAQQLERLGAFEAAVGLYAEAISVHATAPREWTTQLTQMKNRLAAREYEIGVRLMATDVSAAIGHLEAALRFAPDHTQARLRLERARRMQQNLRSIGPAPKGN